MRATLCGLGIDNASSAITGVFMGFEMENNKLDNDQLSLFDFQNVGNEPSRSDSDLLLKAHLEPQQSKASRFITMSAAVHATALLVMAMITIPLVEQAKTETVTIEIEDINPPLKASQGALVPETQGGTPAQANVAVADSFEELGSPQPVTAKATQSASNTVSTSAKSVAAKTNFQAVPMSLDDIEAPELEAGELAATTVPSTLDEDFNDDFESIDRSKETLLANARKSMEDMAAAVASENDESLNAIDEESKAEAEKLSAAQEALRKKNAQTIASALAAEKAAAAQKEAAARDAATRKSGLGGNGEGFGSKNGAGAGNTGSNVPSQQLAGLPQGIRSLDQLKQLPGNPRPQYDREERRRGDQGKVTFVAYISKDGFPSQFRQLESTGFKNLDEKTLAALKKWRFYPGQEGWVELPFRWDLKGGLQEDGGLLRRSISRR